MLRKTFVHVPGIGATTERSLWKQGCVDWQAYVAGHGEYSTGQADRRAVLDFIRESEAALTSARHQFFAKHLGLKDSWRAYTEFKDSCVYLDIETDGSSITMIGLYDGTSYTCLLKGASLENFRDLISRYAMIVTFCGGTFDLPALQKAFGATTFDQIHIDLCPLLRKVGYRGGLKRIERELGIVRPTEVEGLTGFDAVVLWRRYYGLGDQRALERLIAYNREDCINLAPLAEVVFAKMEAATLGAFAPTAPVGAMD